MILQAIVSCPGTTFENGEILWKVCGPDHCEKLPNGTLTKLKFIFSCRLLNVTYENTTGCVDFEVDMCGSKWCVFTVEMSRGRGDNAWQHAQVARQSTKELNRFPLSLRILFGSLD